MCWVIYKTNACVMFPNVLAKRASDMSDAEKHERGIDAAGARVRKVLSDISNQCKETRASVQAARNARKGA